MAATSAPPVRLDRVSLTKIQMRALELALYQCADVINRLKPEEAPYTKIPNPEVTRG